MTIETDQSTSRQYAEGVSPLTQVREYPMSEHTPGPWKRGEYDEHLGYDCMTGGIRCGPCVLDGRDYGQRHCEDIDPADKAHMEADAHLIAAAPDLLEALKSCVKELAQLNHECAAGREATHALSKAWGDWK